MAIRNWHYGKIILLWIWGIAIILLSLNMLESAKNFLFGFLLIILIVGMPVILSIITWKWLGGKEHKNVEKDNKR